MLEAVENNNTSQRRFSYWFRMICWLLIWTFGAETFSFDLLRIKTAQAQSPLMVAPGTLLTTSPAFSMPLLRAISIDRNDPLKIDFVVDSGNESSVGDEQLKVLTKYFLTFLTIPEEDLWVNLSPYEKNRIIKSDLEVTDVGRDMLAGDYLLKQMTASLTHPDTEPGKTFWKKILTRAYEEFGVVDVPISTFNKVWVVPEKAVVYEQAGSAFIGESRLKVLLEEDYLAFRKNQEAQEAEPFQNSESKKINTISSRVAREIIIPELEKEVNEGKNFAPLRQMFHSLVLAIWFKQRLRTNIVTQMYADQKKIAGIENNESQVKEKIYAQYLQAMKKGVYNFIREDYNEKENVTVTRKYFSGGFSFSGSKRWFNVMPVSRFRTGLQDWMDKAGKRLQHFQISLQPIGGGGRSKFLAMAMAGSIGAVAPQAMGLTSNNVGTAVLAVEQGAPIDGKNGQNSISKTKEYSLSTNTTAIASGHDMVAKMGGIIEGFDASKQDYKAGETILTIRDLELAARKSQLRQEIQTAQARLDDLRKLAENGSATAYEITQAQRVVNDLQGELAKVSQQNALTEVRVPQAIRVKDLNVDNGMTIEAGKRLFNYFSKDRIVLNLEVPMQASDLGNFQNLMINGQPVQRIISVKWSLNPSQTQAVATMEVVPGSEISPAAEISVTGKMSGAKSISNSTLSSIQGKGHASALVRDFNQRIISAPAQGSVKFLAREGDRVKAGDVVAVVNGDSYLQEYASMGKALQDIEAQIQRGLSEPGEVSHISRTDMDHLRNERARLIAQLSKLGSQIARLGVRAPQGGIVTQISSLQSSAFQEGDELMRVRTDQVYIGESGNPENMKLAALFSKDIDLAENEPVMVQTLSGNRFPGRIKTINKSPVGQSSLADVQAVEIRVEDPQFILSPGLPVTIIVPKDENEKAILNETLTKAEKVRSQSQDKQSAEERSRLAQVSTWQGKLVERQLVTTTLVSEAGDSNTNLTSGTMLDIATLGSTIQEKNLDVLNVTLEHLKSQAAQGLMDSGRLSLNGFIGMQDGRITFSGGVSGAIGNDGLGGGFLGSLAGAAFDFASGGGIASGLPVILSIAGEIMDLITDKKGKEVAVAVGMTEIAKLHVEQKIDMLTEQAAELLVEIGAAEEKIKQLTPLASEYKKAQTQMEERATSGETTFPAYATIQRKVAETNQQVLALKGKVQELTVQLNHILSGVAGMEIHDKVNPVLPWSGDFASLNDSDEAAMLASLTGEQSDNPNLREALKAKEVLGKIAELQNSGHFPSIDVSDLFISKDKGLRPLKDLPGNIRTSAVKAQNNVGINFSYDLSNKKRDAEDTIVSTENRQADNNIDRAKAEIGAILAQSAAAIRHLSEEIKKAEQAYKAARSSYQTAASRTDIYTADKIVDLQGEMVKAHGRVTDLKADYFMAETKLRELRVLKNNETLVTLTTQPAETMTVTQVNIVTKAVPQPMVWTGAEKAFGNKRDDGSFLVGTITYDFGNGASLAKTMTLMSATSGNPQEQVEQIKKILNEEPNIATRHGALNDLFTEYQVRPDFPAIAKDILMTTTHTDVSDEILKLMRNRNDKDIKFFVAVIDEATKKGKKELANLSYQALSEIFALNPEVFNTLTEVNFTHVSAPGAALPADAITPAIARKVFLTFLAREPEHSVARANFLQSHYWTSEQSAAIVVHLNMYVDQNPNAEDKAQVNKVSDLILANIRRQAALENLGEVYRISPQHDSFSFFHRDVDELAKINLKEEAIRQFLTSSPEWQNMNDYLPKGLVKKADDSTEDLLSKARAAIGERTPVLNESPLEASLVLNVKSGTPTAYFGSLSLAEQKTYVDETQKAADLARLLYSNVNLQGEIIEQLISTFDGRIAVLDAYALSTDEEFLKLVESRNWVEPLKMDVKNVVNPGANGILRSALDKMYKRTNEQVYLNLRLRLYGYSELHSTGDSDTVVQGEVKRTATRMALSVLKAREAKEAVLWTGYSLYTPAQREFLNTLSGLIETSVNPDDVSQYIETMMSDGEAKALAIDIVSIRDKIAKDILNNFLDIPKAPTSFKVLLTFLLGGIGYLIHRMFARGISRKATLAEKITYLRNKLIFDLDGAPKLSPNEVISIPANIDEVHRTSLEAWRNTVNGWAQNPPNVEQMMTNLNTILNYGFTILREVPYSSELIWQGDRAGAEKNESYQRTLSYFNFLLIDTMNILNGLLENDAKTMSQIQRARLTEDEKVLKQQGDYVVHYLRILEYRGNLDKVMSYKFNENHGAERSKIYPFIRWALLYTYQWKASEEGLRREIPIVLEKGNALIRDKFYNESALAQESFGFIKKVTDGAINLSSGGSSLSQRNTHKMRSFWSRVRTISVPVGFFALLIAAAFNTAGAGFGLSILGALGTIVSLLIFWIPHVQVTKMIWNRTMTDVIDDFDRALQNTLALSDNTIMKAALNVSPADQSAFFAVREGWQKRKEEMDSRKTPNVDMVVVISDNDTKGALEDFVRKGRSQGRPDDFRGKIFRNDIPTEIVLQQRKGSGNAYLEAAAYIQNRFAAGAYSDEKRYPHMKGKSWNTARILFVFNGNGILKNDRILEWSIMNGYRAAASMAKTRKDPGGQILVYTNEAYFGPVEYVPDSDVSLITAWETTDEIAGGGLVDTNAPVTGETKVLGVYEKPDVQALRASSMERLGGKPIFNHLFSKRNLDNSALRQFMGLTGIIALSPKAADSLGSIALQANVRDALTYLHFTGDLLVPLVKGKKMIDMDEIQEYVKNRQTWDDFKNYYSDADMKKILGSLRMFYKVVPSFSTGVAVHAYVPRPLSEEYVHIKGRDDLQKALRKLNTIYSSDGFSVRSSSSSAVIEQNAAIDSAQVQEALSPTGGVDMSTTRNQILFKNTPVGNSNIPPQLPPNLLNMPLVPTGGVFQGFKFQIILREPMANPADFFVGLREQENDTVLAQSGGF